MMIVKNIPISLRYCLQRKKKLMIVAVNAVWGCFCMDLNLISVEVHISIQIANLHPNDPSAFDIQSLKGHFLQDNRSHCWGFEFCFQKLEYGVCIDILIQH